MKDVTVCVRVTDLAALAVGFHVGGERCRRLEHFEAFQAAMVGALVEARGQMQLQMFQFVKCFPVNHQLPHIDKRVGRFHNLRAFGEGTVIHVIRGIAIH